jgi:hypothetical protein
MKSGNIPSNQIRGYRKVYTQGLAADNQSIQVDLPRGPAIEAAFVVVTGSINITAAGTAVRADAANKYVTRVDHVLNGNITLDAMTGYGYGVFDKWIQHGETPIVNPTTFNTGANSFQSVIPVSRVLSDMARPKDAVLKTDASVTLNQLRIQFGTLAGMFVGAPTVAYTSVSFSVYSIDYQETPDANGNTPVPLYYWKKTEQLLSLQSTGTGLPFRVNTGNRLRALILVPQDNVNSEPTVPGTQISRVRVVRSGDTRVDLDTPGFSVFSTYSNPASGIGAQNDVGGTEPIVIDFANHLGLFRTTKYSELWPVPSNSDVQLQLDVAAIGTARLITLEGVDLQSS